MTDPPLQGAGSRPPAGASRLSAVLTQLLVTAAVGLGCAGGTAGGDPLLVTGVVVDPAGRPVADARIAVTTAPVDVPDVGLLSAEDGRFSIAVPAEGTYGITAVTDRGRAEGVVYVRRGQVDPVRLVVPS